MFNRKLFILLAPIIVIFLTNCGVHFDRVALTGYYQDYNINEQRTVIVGSEMLSNFNYKNSCYDYIALIDYETPRPGVELSSVVIKKGNQYTACFQDTSNDNYVYMKGVHVYNHLFLGIEKNGFIGDRGGWYNSYRGIRIFQSSWTKEQLFALSDAKFYPGFDSKSERLIYLGMDDGKIRLGYRLVNYNSSKQNESQDIIYNLRDGNTITFQNYTLKIIDADNTKITFIIVSDKKDN